MSAEVLEADYVVIGAGATAMAFADVVVAESDRTLILVDRHAQPGGHWNLAYSFVRLHQPSDFYGVSSRPLGRHVRDVAGLNAGLFELASGHEVLAYFDDVMRQQLLPSGRVTYLPMSEYLDGGRIVSTVSGAETRAHARRRIVDARYRGSEVPSAHTPTFDVDERVTFIPINGLTSLDRAPSSYVVLGGGKTSVDACLWLLEQGVEPHRIVWVRPQDLWLLNRARVQPDATQLTTFADLLEASAQASDVDDLVGRLERAEVLLRIDPDHWPTTFRGATASVAEVDALGVIEQVVRLGHVTAIEPGHVHLERGQLEVDEGCVYVDCTAEGLRRVPPVPTFRDDTITLQYSMPFGVPTYSAALTARVELAGEDDAIKNRACPALPGPNELRDLASYLLARLEAPQVWGQLPGVEEWTNSARLNPTTWALGAVQPDDEAAQGAIVRVLELSGPAEENLRRLLAAVGP